MITIFFRKKIPRGVRFAANFFVMRFLFLLPAHRPGRPRSLYRASFEGRRRRRRIRRFRDGYVRGGASAQAPTGCYFRALRRSNRAAQRLGLRYAPSLASSGLSPSVGVTRLHTLGAPFRLHAAARLGPRCCRRDCAAAFRLHSAARVFRPGDGLLSSSVSLRTTKGEETEKCLPHLFSRRI